MKTTIQIPDEIWKKLNIEAAERQQKGFSGIVTEAIEYYFAQKERAQALASRRKRAQLARQMFASLSQKEAAEELETLQNRRKQWHARS
jgi:predicted CopG family antitoxin